MLAFEPDPANHAAARVNLAQHARSNGLANVTLVAAAVAGGTGTLRFSAEGAMGSADAGVVGGRGEVITVSCVGLEDIVRVYAPGRIDFIKMDIEGSELAALRGAGECLARFKPRLMIEPHLVDGELSAGEVMRLLEAQGYRCAVIEQTGARLPLVTAAHPEGPAAAAPTAA